MAATIHSGYLFKKGTGGGVFGRRNWKLRYFVLTATSLQYFAGPTKRLRGELSLTGSEQFTLEMMPAESLTLRRSGSDACIPKWRLVINTPERRLLLAACTEAELKTWTQQLAVAFVTNQRWAQRAATIEDPHKNPAWVYSFADTELTNETDLLDSSGVLATSDGITLCRKQSSGYLVLDDLVDDAASSDYYYTDCDAGPVMETPRILPPFGRPSKQRSGVSIGRSGNSNSNISLNHTLLPQQSRLWLHDLDAGASDSDVNESPKRPNANKSTFLRAAQTMIRSNQQ